MKLRTRILYLPYVWLRPILPLVNACLEPSRYRGTGHVPLLSFSQGFMPRNRGACVITAAVHKLYTIGYLLMPGEGDPYIMKTTPHKYSPMSKWKTISSVGLYSRTYRIYISCGSPSPASTYTGVPFGLSFGRLPRPKLEMWLFVSACS